MIARNDGGRVPTRKGGVWGTLAEECWRRRDRSRRRVLIVVGIQLAQPRVAGATGFESAAVEIPTRKGGVWGTRAEEC